MNNSVNIFSNGFLVTEDFLSANNSNYCGVDKNAWPVGIESDVLPTAQDRVEASYMDLSTPFLIDQRDLLTYVQACKQSNIAYRILYCEAYTRDFLLDKQLHNTYGKSEYFIGCDYAYPSGDYFSAIWNDVICCRSCFADSWKRELNQFELLPNLHTALLFAQDRKRALNDFLRFGCAEPMEQGFFQIFSLFEITKLFEQQCK